MTAIIIELERYRRDSPADCSYETVPYRETTNSSLEKPFLGAGMKFWTSRWLYRRQLTKDLLGEPDSVLADAGMTRQELLKEIAKPFWRP